MVTGKHSGKHVVGGRVPDYHLVIMMIMIMKMTYKQG